MSAVHKAASSGGIRAPSPCLDSTNRENSLQIRSSRKPDCCWRTRMSAVHKAAKTGSHLHVWTALTVKTDCRLAQVGSRTVVGPLNVLF